MDSILETIKRLLGIDGDYDAFDAELIVYINGVIRSLTQIGVGNQHGFSITSDIETWADFLGDDLPNLENVKTYIALKVKLIFDPPQSSTAVEAIKGTISECEWRIYETMDSKGGES